MSPFEGPVMKRAPTALLVSLLLLAGASQACVSLPPDQIEQKRKEQLAQMKTDLRALQDEADTVFIGYLGKLTHVEKVEDPEARFPNILLVHQAYFRNVQLIKGRYRQEQPLEFTTSKTRITISCRSELRDSQPGEHGAGETYLVYAKDGKILRTNRMPYQKSGLMDGQEEADFLRGSR